MWPRTRAVSRGASLTSGCLAQATLRTCDCLGIQHVWLVGGAAAAAAAEPAAAGGPTGSAADDAARWLTVRQFHSTAECITALRAEQSRTEIWATDLSQSAERLDAVLRRCGAGRGGGSAAGEGSWGSAARPGKSGRGMPGRVALVLGGSEAEGVSQEMLLAADRRIYLPLHGRSITIVTQVLEVFQKRNVLYLRLNISNMRHREVHVRAKLASQMSH